MQSVLGLRWHWALLSTLPIQLLAVLWLAEVDSRYRDFVRYQQQMRRPDDPPLPPFDRESWRFIARDHLRRTVARWSHWGTGAASPLEEFQLQISDKRRASLDADLPKSGLGDAKRARLVTPDGAFDVKARYLGDNHWHWLFAKKSWRCKLPDDASWRQRAVLTFKNPPSILLFDEAVVADVAREIGLLTPTVRPVRLGINGGYTGAYLYWDVVDESLLRRERRMPGSIFSGDGAPADPTDGVSRLFADPNAWKKDASRNEERKTDRSEIEALLAAIAADLPTFAAFAERHLDLDRYARFVALDRVFGSAHHDYHHNHKLYFDPYRGRFEPIAWDLNDWQLEARPEDFDVVLNPLLIALRCIPAIELTMQRTLYGLLGTSLRPERIGARLAEFDVSTREALAADDLRDVRSFTALQFGWPLPYSELLTVADYQAELADRPQRYAARHARLLALCDDCRIGLQVTATPAGRTLDLTSHGRVAARATALVVDGRGPGAPPLRLRLDRNRNGVLDDDDPVVAESQRLDGRDRLPLAELLHPGLCEQPAPPGTLALLFGRTQLAVAPLAYRWFLCGAMADDATVAVALENAVTGRPVPAGAEAPAPAVRVRSLHPWDLPAPRAPAELTLGPGPVVVDRTREIDPATTLRILPGTTLRMGRGVSLLCRGRLLAIGQPDAPIVVEPADPAAPWGTFAVQGPASSGSHFAHCRIHGGTAQDLAMLQLTGMVNIADTSDLTIDSCRFGANAAGDDALHLAYVTGGRVAGCTFTGAPADACDLDICRDLSITGCTFVGAGNDGLDLMTCDVAVRNCRFERCRDKGISVGEATTLQLGDNAWSECAIGIQVKDDSTVRAGASRMVGCGIGVSMLHKNPRYDAAGTVAGQSLVCERTARPIEPAAGSKAQFTEVLVDGRSWTP